MEVHDSAESREYLDLVDESRIRDLTKEEFLRCQQLFDDNIAGRKWKGSLRQCVTGDKRPSGSQEAEQSATEETESPEGPFPKMLVHVIQRLPEGISIQEAWNAGMKIIRMRGVCPGARFYLEQDGDKLMHMGKRIHIHIAMFTTLKKCVLAQRIVRKEFAIANMTQVYPHNNLHALIKYLSGQKSSDKMRKVAIDHMWRKRHGLQMSYGRADVFCE